MKRQVTSPQDPPVLDEGTFQQLLAAAYTLQEQAGRPMRSVVPEAVCPVSRLEPALRVAQASIEQSPPPRDPTPFHRNVRKRILLTDKLFWKAASVAALAAVSALLLAATLHRFSPLPPGLARPVDVVLRPVPIQEHIMTIPTQTCSGGTETAATELSPAKAQKTIVRPHRLHHTHVDESDVVAEDTVIRYRTSSKAPRLQAQTTPVRP